MDPLQVICASSVAAEAYATALQLGVCVRCCLRFANVQNLDVYTCSEEKLNNACRQYLEDNGVNTAEIFQQDEGLSASVDVCLKLWRDFLFEYLSRTGVCTCCAGVLNANFQVLALAEVRRLAKESNYDVSSFGLNIKLPSSVLLREYSLLQYLRQNLSGFPTRAPFDLKDVLKFLITEEIATAFNQADCSNSSDFAVLIDVKHEESVDEVKQLPAIKQQLESSKKRRRGPQPVFDGFGAVSRAISALSAIPDTVKCPPSRLTTFPIGEVTLEREPVYLQGRYLKYKRGLSQTPWILDGVRMGESSVEEAIGDIALPFFRGKGYKFHTAGREDVDVRMLGNGRPFILEILDAKKAKLTPEEYKAIQNAVNTVNDGAVEIRNVKLSTKEYFAGLQAGADSKKKTYCCVVWSQAELTPNAVAKLDAIHDLTIQQQTPIRVLHRRTLMTRPKIIHDAKCEVLNKHYMLLRLTTSAGTYVKEFVHGDRGRTQPNVSSILGCDADILQLDVENLIDAQ